ncbi:hypothetical protein TrVE_jg3864 [Triparma verrucosa]|uniref:Ankyrin repeat protein n=1 Tax=Triparma verrucosa TaxID=1606542 RepID=A0A9W7F0T0_9STRA|nr:hypothetical protein TrVE_jg3864 [Triparma verrucosa]
MSICGDMTSSGGLIRDFFWGCEELEGGNPSKPVEERGGLDVDCFCVDPANIDVHFNDVLDDFFSENGDDDVNDEEGWNESQSVLFGDDDSLPTMTALHLSCQNGNYPVVEFLCGRLEYEGGKRGGMADVNLSDRNGWTPAHFACVGKDEVAACKILKCLKKAGADLMREAGNGYTPYALVKRLGGSQEICDCLEEMGAGVFHNPGQTSFFFQKNFGEVFESGVETAKEMLMGAGGQNNEEG